MKRVTQGLLVIGLIAITTNSNAQNWAKSVLIGGDGVSEMGKYIDFHETHEGLEDYSLRLSIAGGRFESTGAISAPGFGVNTKSFNNGELHVFGNSPSVTNLILSANYENQYRWKFKTIDRGNAIDLDIVGTYSGDQEEQLIKLSPSISGRPEFTFLDNWFVINNGQIGIGTATPKEKLSVNGKIRAHEIKVETNNWPDYVFEDTYAMSSLDSLENYIKNNKHLPEIPSALEVEQNGIALGAMNGKLLKKIEELTLHLIDKNKQLTEMKNRQNSADEKMKALLDRIEKLEMKENH